MKFTTRNQYQIFNDNTLVYDARGFVPQQYSNDYDYSPMDYGMDWQSQPQAQPEIHQVRFDTTTQLHELESNCSNTCDFGPCTFDGYDPRMSGVPYDYNMIPEQQMTPDGRYYWNQPYLDDQYCGQRSPVLTPAYNPRYKPGIPCGPTDNGALRMVGQAAVGAGLGMMFPININTGGGGTVPGPNPGPSPVNKAPSIGATPQPNFAPIVKAPPTFTPSFPSNFL